MCRSKAEGGRRCRPKKTGFPTVVDSIAGTALSGRPGREGRSRAALLQVAQEQLSDLLGAAVSAAPPGSIATIVSAVDADVANQVADAITGILEAHGRPRASWQSHLLCGALAVVAHTMISSEELAKAVVGKAVTEALVVRGVPRLVAGLAGRAAADTLMKLTPVRHWEDVRRAIQLLAVSMCPKVADHPEVEQYCLQPLASEFLSPAVQEELAGLLPSRIS